MNMTGAANIGGAIIAGSETNKDIHIFSDNTALGHNDWYEYASFSHTNNIDASGSYALLQSPEGYTYLNAASLKEI